MNKKLLLLTITILLLACNFLFPQANPPASTLASTPELDRLIATPSDPEATEFQSIGFTIVRLRPSDGDLQPLLAQEAQKAAALGQMPVVEFDATWCPPCLAIDRAIQEKNALILNAYKGTYIIKLDVDEWGWGDSNLHDFEFSGIPVYFKLDSEGKQTGEVIDGGAWGQDIPENIAPVMDQFFHGE